MAADWKQWGAASGPGPRRSMGYPRCHWRWSSRHGTTRPSGSLNGQCSDHSTGTACPVGGYLLGAVTRGNATSLARVQGAYYVASGLWPLVHLPSFLAVTGPKAEHWLVRTVGLLTTVIGAQLLVAARSDAAASVAPLGAGAAVAFATIDTLYVGRRRIRPVYLLDAAAQLPLALAWLWSRSRKRSGL